MRKFLKNEQGFTLVELMLVVAVIAILAAVLIPKMANVKNTARETGVAGNVRTIESYAVSMIDKYPDSDPGAFRNDLVKKLGDLVNPVSKLTQTNTTSNTTPDYTNGLPGWIAPVHYGQSVSGNNTWVTDNNCKGSVGLAVWADGTNGVTVVLTPFDSQGVPAANQTDGQVVITKTRN